MPVRSIYDAPAFLEGPGEDSAATPGFGWFQGDYESGNLAQRNLRKALNHLDLLRAHESCAKRLGVHEDVVPSALFEANRKLLCATEQTQLSLEPTITGLAENARMYGKTLTPEEVRSLLGSFYQVAHVEFHPTDVCNLRCQGCTYARGRSGHEMAPSTFPFDRVHEIVSLRPRSLLFIGGGEPLLYRSQGRTFSDLVHRMRDLLPVCRFGLVSNGTHYPQGDWAQEMSWIRYSVDASGPVPFAAFRGRNLFSRVCDNLLRTLRTTTVRVSVGFLFSRANIGDAVAAIRFFHSLVECECPEALSRFSIQFRPLRRNLGEGDRPFPAAITREDRDQVERALRALANEPGLQTFLREQTNCEVIGGGNEQLPLDFDRCLYSTVFRLIRANGDLRPCFVRASQPGFHLGNILVEAAEKIALAVLATAAYLQPGCNAQQCRQCHINWMLQRGLEGRAKPSHSPAVASDPFF